MNLLISRCFKCMPIFISFCMVVFVICLSSCYSPLKKQLPEPKKPIDRNSPSKRLKNVSMLAEIFNEDFEKARMIVLLDPT